MTPLVILGVLVLISFALWQKWRSLPQQTRLLIGAIFGIVGSYRQMKKQHSTPHTARHTNKEKVQEQATSMRMIACSKCGLHVLEGEGVHINGRFYCCTEHVK